MNQTEPLCQDLSRGLSQWLSSQPGARRLVRERCQEIQKERIDMTPTAQTHIPKGDGIKAVRCAQFQKLTVD